MTEHVPRLPLWLHPLIAEAKRRARQRRALVVLCVLLMAGLAGGLTLALRSPGSGGGGGASGRLGAFNGLSAARHTTTGINVLPPAVLADLRQQNSDSRRRNAYATKHSLHVRFPLELLNTARLLGATPVATVYVPADTAGDLCHYAVFGRIGGTMSGDANCVRPLSKSHPVTLTAGGNYFAKVGSFLTVDGIAIDSVTSLSFIVSNKDVTLPIHNNLLTFKRHSNASTLQCVVAHFADGSTVTLAGYRCPSH